MFPENCFCTLEDIKVGSHEFSRNQKIVTDSLRSKRFQSRYCAKVRAETKKRLKGEGEGEGRRGNVVS